MRRPLVTLLRSITALAVAAAGALAQAPATLVVEADKPAHAIPDEFFGLMTEEINHAYDGGLYAELIQNRTFQDPRPERRGPGAGPGGGGRRIDDRLPIHWSVIGPGKATVEDADPVNAALPRSLAVDLAEGAESGVVNDGYWGIPVRPNTTYTASFYAQGSGGFAGPVAASIRLEQGGAVVARAESASITGQWKKYTLTLATGADAPTTARAWFVLSATGPGRVRFSLVSLFPPTYQNAPNGLRPDLMELMAALRPKFIRLPGGNYLEGGRFADRFNWKAMIGPIEGRPGHMAPWGYRSSDGMGLPEFLLWCKQLGAEPILGLFAGYVLNGDHFKAGSPELAIYTQEALEEIEYVAGPAEGEWGKRRAADGFPEPFPLRYVEIGNEDWFDRSGSYDGRFAEMARAIRAKYPNLKIIASAPVTSFAPDLVDDHFYRTANELFRMATMYDPRPADAPAPVFNGGGYNARQPNGGKTFVGEWATQEGRPTPTHNAALADAAFIMGLEKNSDAVQMQCYAPLLVNVNEADPAKGYPRAWQWNTNLIGYDALRSFGSPSYHAQVMLAQNKGDVVLPARLEVPAAEAAEEPPRGRVGVGAWHTEVEYADLSVTAPDGRALLTPDQARDRSRWQTVGGDWTRRGEAIVPASRDAETWAFVGDPSWTDYTVRVRARKVAGAEGFILLWHAADGESYRWWNVGGWENTQARAEAAVGGRREPYGTGTPFSVEAGRWYDLRLEVAGRRMRGYVDGKLVTEATDETRATAPAATTFATATHDRANGAILVKVVNRGRAPVAADVDVRGVARLGPGASATVLAGEPEAVNTLDEPRRVAPRAEPLAASSPRFRHTFPPHSLTILRLPAAAP
jgi:alpha-L-arabinofuranosidase